MRTLFLAAAFVVASGCGTGKKRKVIATAPPPPLTTQPIEEATPNEQEAKAIQGFFESARGKWLGNCVTNDQQKSSYAPGFEVYEKVVKVASHKWPPNNINCWGNADTTYSSYSIKAIRQKEEGWFFLRTSCEGNCTRVDQDFLIKLDKYLYVRRLKENGALEDSVVFMTGPSQ